MATILETSYAWVSTNPTTLSPTKSPHSSLTRLYEQQPSEESRPFDFLTNPYESKIPDELKDEIYQAEANTPAAKERGQRVALYAVIALFGVLSAFFNGFLSELRAGGGPENLPPTELADTAFAWVESNFVTKFLLLNKVGGAICLLSGAAAGLLAEAELDTKRINAEKIYEELERRRGLKSNKNKKSKKKKAKLSGKGRKRMSALSEVITEESEPVPAPGLVEEKKPEPKGEEVEKNDDGEGLFGKMKGFYEKADAMAASQALLLNKQLEDAGVVDKITDETGLKVIGKEEAAKLKEKNQVESSSTSTDDKK